jgi:hypothetical protein
MNALKPSEHATPRTIPHLAARMAAALEEILEQYPLSEQQEVVRRNVFLSSGPDDVQVSGIRIDVVTCEPEDAYDPGEHGHMRPRKALLSPKVCPLWLVYHPDGKVLLSVRNACVKEFSSMEHDRCIAMAVRQIRHQHRS